MRSRVEDLKNGRFDFDSGWYYEHSNDNHNTNVWHGLGLGGVPPSRLELWFSPTPDGKQEMHRIGLHGMSLNKVGAANVYSNPGQLRVQPNHIAYWIYGVENYIFSCYDGTWRNWNDGYYRILITR